MAIGAPIAAMGLGTAAATTTATTATTATAATAATGTGAAATGTGTAATGTGTGAAAEGGGTIAKQGAQMVAGQAVQKMQQPSDADKANEKTRADAAKGHTTLNADN